MPKQEAEAAAFARGQSQPAGRGQIGQRTVMRQFDDDARQGAALERFFHCPQRIERTRDFEDQKPRALQSEKIAAGTIDVAALDSGKVGLYAERIAATFGGARGQRQCKARRRADIAHRRRRDIMQAGSGQAALQQGVDSADTQGQHRAAAAKIGFLAFDFRHSLPETMQGGWHCSGHGEIPVLDLF